MTNKPPKTVIAIVVFTLFEALALRLVVIAPFHLLESVPFMNDAVLNVFALGIAAVVAYLIGKLLFEKWDAKFGAKVAVAAGLVLVSFVFSRYLVMVIDRYIAQKNYF